MSPFSVVINTGTCPMNPTFIEFGSWSRLPLLLSFKRVPASDTTPAVVGPSLGRARLIEFACSGSGATTSPTPSVWSVVLKYSE